MRLPFRKESQPVTPQTVHTDTYGKIKRKRKDPDVDEQTVYKRNVSADERKSLASKGHALRDGSYPIANAGDLSNAAHLAASGHGNAAAAKALIARRAKELGVENPLSKAEFVVPIWKNDAQHLVYGVVLEPNLEDSQGDIMTPEEIEKCAHEWLVQARKMDVQHSEGDEDVYPVESFCAPIDMLIPDPQGGDPHMVTKGSWVMGAKVNEAGAWDDVVAGRLTGFSIQGSGVRTPVEA